MGYLLALVHVVEHGYPILLWWVLTSMSWWMSLGGSLSCKCVSIASCLSNQHLVTGSDGTRLYLQIWSYMAMIGQISSRTLRHTLPQRRSIGTYNCVRPTS